MGTMDRRRVSLIGLMLALPIAVVAAATSDGAQLPGVSTATRASQGGNKPIEARDSDKFPMPEGAVEARLSTLHGTIAYSCALVAAPGAAASLDPARAAAAASLPGMCPKTLFYGLEAINFTIMYIPPDDGFDLLSASLSVWLTSALRPRSRSLTSFPSQHLIHHKPATPYTFLYKPIDINTFPYMYSLFDPASPESGFVVQDLDAETSSSSHHMGVPVVALVAMQELSLVGVSAAIKSVESFATAQLNIVNGTRFMQVENAAGMGVADTASNVADNSFGLSDTAKDTAFDAASGSASNSDPNSEAATTSTSTMTLRPTMVIPSSATANFRSSPVSVVYDNLSIFIATMGIVVASVAFHHIHLIA